MTTDLSFINSIADLEAAESALRQRIGQRERIMQQEAATLPGKVGRTVARKTLPFLLGATVAVVGTRLIVGAFKRRNKKKSENRASLLAAPLAMIKESPFVPLLFPVIGKLVRSWMEKKAQQVRNRQL